MCVESPELPGTKTGVTIDPGKKWYSILLTEKQGESNDKDNSISGAETN
jgi:hypothetical protein